MSDRARTTTVAHEGAREERRRSDRRRPSVRIAAVGDIHLGPDTVGTLRTGFARANEEADILLLAGDLTRHGTPTEMQAAVGELVDVRIPIVAVLGNHDHESGQTAEACAVLRERGIHLMDGDTYELNEQVGIVGVKGYMGGYGRRRLTPFGEPHTKEFVTASMTEVHKLELALQRLTTPVRVALLHYAPVVETIEGEPEQIYPFLGTDRLAEPLDRYEVAVCFHGHAHHGSFRGTTMGGVPVFNVSHDLIRREGVGDAYFLYEIPLEQAGTEDEEETVEAGSSGD